MIATSTQKLHIGCFDQVLDGWINTDVTPHIYVAKVPGLPFLLRKVGRISHERYTQHQRGVFRNIRYLNVARRFPWEDETFDAVYSSHLLEHLYPEQALSCLREAHRILREGGVIRVAVPDLDTMIGEYDWNDPDAFLDIFFEGKQRLEKNRHHWHYNALSLQRVLRRAGFRETDQCQYQQGRCADVATIDCRPDSLFVEGIK